MWKKPAVLITTHDGNAGVSLTKVYDTPPKVRQAVGLAKVPGPSNNPTPAIGSAPETLPGARLPQNITAGRSTVASTVQTKPATGTPRAFKQAPLQPASSTTNLYGAKGRGEGAQGQIGSALGNRNIGQSAKVVKRSIVGQPRAAQVPGDDPNQNY